MIPLKIGVPLLAALAILGLGLSTKHYRALYHGEVQLRLEDRTKFVQATNEAYLMAQQAVAAAEARYKAKAEEADHVHQVELASARAAAERYIAAHRVRLPASQGPAGEASAAAGGGGAGVREDLPAAGVVVSEDDVRACTATTAYALDLRAWALSLPPRTDGSKSDKGNELGNEPAKSAP